MLTEIFLIFAIVASVTVLATFLTGRRRGIPLAPIMFVFVGMMVFTNILDVLNTDPTEMFESNQTFGGFQEEIVKIEINESDNVTVTTVSNITTPEYETTNLNDDSLLDLSWDI